MSYDEATGEFTTSTFRARTQDRPVLVQWTITSDGISTRITDASATDDSTDGADGAGAGSDAGAGAGCSGGDGQGGGGGQGVGGAPFGGQRGPADAGTDGRDSGGGGGICGGGAAGDDVGFDLLLDILAVDLQLDAEEPQQVPVPPPRTLAVEITSLMDLINGFEKDIENEMRLGPLILQVLSSESVPSSVRMCGDLLEGLRVCSSETGLQWLQGSCGRYWI